jgi:hypothetical protein
MSEGKADADCDIAVAKRVDANRLGRPPTRRPRQLEESISNRAAKCRRAARGDDIPRTRVRPPRCDHAHDVHRGLDRMRGHDGAERRRALGIAREREVKPCTLALCSHTQVGGNRVEVERTAAIERDRELRSDVRRESCCGERAPQLGGDRARIEHLFRNEPGESIAQNRWTFAKWHLDSGDRRRQVS